MIKLRIKPEAGKTVSDLSNEFSDKYSSAYSMKIGADVLEVIQNIDDDDRAILDFAPFDIPENDGVNIIITKKSIAYSSFSGEYDDTIERNLKSMGIKHTSTEESVSVFFNSKKEYQDLFYFLGLKDWMVYNVVVHNGKPKVSDGARNMSDVMSSGLLSGSEEKLRVFDLETRGLGPVPRDGERHLIANAPSSLSFIDIAIRDSGDSLSVSLGEFGDSFFNTNLPLEAAEITGMVNVDLSVNKRYYDKDEKSFRAFIDDMCSGKVVLAGHNISTFDIPIVQSMDPRSIMIGIDKEAKYFDTLSASTPVTVPTEKGKRDSRKQTDLFGNILAPKIKGLGSKINEIAHRSIVDCILSSFVVSSIRAKTLGKKMFVVEHVSRGLMDLVERENNEFYEFIKLFIGVEIDLKNGAPKDIIQKAVESLEPDAKETSVESSSILF